MNLHEKLIEIRASIDELKKDGTGYQYKYVTGSQILGKMQAAMDANKVLLVPSIESVNNPVLDEYDTIDKYGKLKHYRDWHVSGVMNYTWVNSEDPTDRIIVPWFFIGQQDDSSKAFGSGLTYAERYFLLKFFGLPTDCEDPDSKEGKDIALKSNQQSPQKSNLVFGDAKNESLPWVTKDNIDAMLAYVADGKKESVIKSLVKYRWSKDNRETIQNALK